MIQTLRAVVHPWHCDVMGHLCTRHYVGFFDDAAFHLVAACGGHVSRESEVGFADVKACYEYRHETHAGELITISSSYSKLGRSSFTAWHEMHRVEDGQVVAVAEVTSVCFDPGSRKSIPMSNSFRAHAESLIRSQPA